MCVYAQIKVIHYVHTVESRYYAPPPREYAPLPFSAKVPAQVFLTRAYAPSYCDYEI